MPSLSRKIPHGSDVERMILQELRRRVKLWEGGTSSKKIKWREAEEKILAFIPERDVDAVRRASREGGLPQYTTIQIPYSYAVVMASHTYLTSVFMGRNPIFQYDGLHGETQQQTQAIEALISYQVMQGRMMPYLYTWLYDALKYGDGITGNWWDEKIDVVSQIVEVDNVDQYTGVSFGKTEKLQLSQPVRSYAGNRVYNVEPQSFIWDTRVPMREFQNGEFAGEKRRVSWADVIRRKEKGYYMNTECIPYSKSGYEYSVAEEGSSQLERPEVFSQIPGEISGTELGHPMQVEFYQIAVEIIPTEWRLADSSWPEKWVFTFTSDYRVLVGAQPLGALHCKFPYSVIPLEPEGYGLTTRGLPEILEPVQNTVDWLINTHFYNVRAALNDRWIADPSRIVMKDLTNPAPGGIVRLRPEAYGTDPKLAIVQFPTSNVTAAHVGSDLPMMFGIGERVGGVNDQIMGMLDTGGGRKTATEVRTSTSFGINRLKTQAEFASACGWDPLSQMLVQNSQQYYDMDLKFKIAGDLMMDAGAGFIQVTPDLIAGGFQFIPVDGTLPIDRNAQVQLWQQMMQMMGSIQQIGMQYDIGGIFSWIAKLAGLKNISQFKIQVTPDQMLQQQAQTGNSIPLNGGGKPNGAAPGAQSNPGYSGSASPKAA